ncbi:hypothetical protein U1Q18_010324 [Sarracenia purpurea var. burkii]
MPSAGTGPTQLLSLRVSFAGQVTILIVLASFARGQFSEFSEVPNPLGFRRKQPFTSRIERECGTVGKAATEWSMKEGGRVQ